MSRTGCVILAAGAGRRLGTVAKALLPGEDGASFLEAIVRCADAAGVEPRVVVVGPPHGLAVEDEARRLGVASVVNPRPERGMASSIAVGFAHAQLVFARTSGALLWPVDHPAVTPEVVARLAAATAARAIAVPVFDGRGGHPTGFGREVWPELVACASAPRGARDVIAADPSRVVRIEVADRAVIADVDTPADRR